MTGLDAFDGDAEPQPPDAEGRHGRKDADFGQDQKAARKAVVRGGAGTATCTVGLLGGTLTYAVEAGIIEANPAHGIRKPKDNVRKRRLSESEYRTLGQMMRAAAEDEMYTTTVDIVRQIALTGCRRSEIITLEISP
jgi:integrase